MIPIRTSVEVREIPGAVIGLIIANIAMFFVQNGLPAELATQFINHNALIPARYTDPVVAGELGLDPVNFLPFLTSTFMHAGWLHLLVNMWTLWLFGGPLEDRLGTPRFVALYLACGLIASVSHFAFNLSSQIPALGASGSIAGVLGGFSLTYPRARIQLLKPILFFPYVFELTAMAYTALWFAFQIIPGLMELATREYVGGIAWWAHIGGFVAGLLMVKPLGVRRSRTREIGEARPLVLEIGDQRPIVVRVGDRVSRGRTRDAAREFKRRFKPAAPKAARAAPSLGATLWDRLATAANWTDEVSPRDEIAAAEEIAEIMAEVEPRRTETRAGGSVPEAGGPEAGGPWEPKRRSV